MNSQNLMMNENSYQTQKVSNNIVSTYNVPNVCLFSSNLMLYHLHSNIQLLSDFIWHVIIKLRCCIIKQFLKGNVIHFHIQNSHTYDVIINMQGCISLVSKERKYLKCIYCNTYYEVAHVFF